MLVPPDYWDPAEELATLLKEAAPTGQTAMVPPPRSEPAPGLDFADPMEKLARITAQFLRRALPPDRGTGRGASRKTTSSGCGRAVL
ncbi:hypothetical protein ACFQ3Z_17930 [Streptomyces nogalater]